MPAGGGAGATQLNGGPEVIDLKVCMSLLKKTIVFFPLLIMVVIFLIKAYLTTDVKTQQMVFFIFLGLTLSYVQSLNNVYVVERSTRSSFKL